MTATLSLGMIVKNEAKFMARVLACAKSFCDEMIVVDTGSTDNTADIAEAMGAKVYHFEWINDFAAARNYSYSKCTGDWIMWLDADDIISEKDQQAFLSLKNDLNDDIDAVYTNYFCGDHHPFFTRERIIRRAAQGIMWQGAIHETIFGIDPNRSISRLDISVTHAYDPADVMQKSQRNREALLKHFESGDRSDRTVDLLLAECRTTEHDEIAKQCIDHQIAHSNDSHSRYKAYMALANMRARNNDTVGQEQALSMAIGVYPRLPDPYHTLALLLAKRGHVLEGLIHCETALRVMNDPQFPREHMRLKVDRLYADLCYFYNATGRHKEAIIVGAKGWGMGNEHREFIEAHIKIAQSHLINQPS